MRVHLPLRPGPGQAMRAESGHYRYGTLACLAAYDVHCARVTGRCEPFTALISAMSGLSCDSSYGGDQSLGEGAGV